MPQSEACVIDHGCLDPTKSIIGCIDNVHPCKKCKLNNNNNNNILSNLQQCPSDHNELTDCNGKVGTSCTIPNKQGCDAGISTLTKTPKSIRNFQIINKCFHDIWVGINGKQRNQVKGRDFESGFIPNDGGFKLKSGETKTINIKNDLHSGVIWGRTNCRYEKYGNSGLNIFKCDTGQCWNEYNERGKNGKCCNDKKCFGPKAPSSLVEFTLSDGWCQNDFYDLSLVDGYNLPIKMEPIDADIPVGTINKYSCGIAKINTFDSKKNCPQEMQLFGTGNENNTAYCLSICKAVSDPDHAKKFKNLTYWALNTTMASEIDPNDAYLQNKRMIDLLCCKCGGDGDIDCYDINKQCSFGCSAFTNDINPPKWKDEGGTFNQYKQRICPNNGKQKQNGPFDINMPKWPMIDGINPAYIYKDTSPNAYSWQFNDKSCTFQCRNSHYKITFCHDNDNHSVHSNQDNKGGFIAAMVLIPIIIIVLLIMLFAKYKQTIQDGIRLANQEASDDYTETSYTISTESS